MPIKQESLNRDLYGLLKSRGYRPEMFTSGGKKVSIPDEAEAFQFDFMKDGENYGKATITIDGLHRLIVYYNNEIANSPKGDGQDISWTTLMKHVKRWAKNKALGFQLSDQDDLESDMAKREYNKIEGLNEGYYAMGKKASYSDNVPSTKIILQHSRQIEEGEQRYRNVEKIFVENAQGERFLLPTNKPGLARVYARHIAEGGTPYDERGTHITSLVEEYQKMAGFVRATRNHQFNESAQRLISEGINHYEKLRETLHKMSGKRGYTEYFNNYSPALMEDEGSTDLSEMFMQSSLDPRIENVMPILGKLSKNLVETEVPHVKELEEWAESVAENRMADLLSAKVSGAVGDIKSSVPNLDRENFEEQLWDYLDAQYGSSVARTAFNNIDDYWMEYQGVTEDLDANQKRVGQLGPTEKITKSNPTRGKLVGASESVEQGVAEGADFNNLVNVDSFRGKLKGREAFVRIGDPRVPLSDKTQFKRGIIDDREGVYGIEHKPGDSRYTYWLKDETGRDFRAPSRDVFVAGEGVAEEAENKDMTGQTCEKCKKGKYQERSQHDDMQGKVTCKCGHRVDRWKKYKEQGVAEGFFGNKAYYVSSENGETEAGSKEEAEALVAKLKKAGILASVKVRKVKEGVAEGSLNEMDKSQPSSDRGGESSGNPYAKGGKGTPIKADKAKKDFAKMFQKNIDKSNKEKKDTEEKVKQHQEVKEGQDDLEAILRIIKK
jgi:hypothetical protein